MSIPFYIISPKMADSRIEKRGSSNNVQSIAAPSGHGSYTLQKYLLKNPKLANGNYRLGLWWRELERWEEVKYCKTSLFPPFYRGKT